MPAWRYLQGGGKLAELIWHRRSGKDDLALNYSAVAAFKRPATYWHMLPQASQARKAIWEAVNPHTGIRRIDEAFPRELRATTREQEMMIKFRNGSTWQVVGSDNFNSLVGSPPAGIVYSEWALANPSARAYLRPILMENNGWQIFITTPRGKNHAYKTYQSALKTPGVFAQTLTAGDTNIISQERLDIELQGYIDDYGEDQGTAFFQQEWWCSFDAAVMGAYYALEMQWLQANGRITDVEYNSDYPVYAAFDIGKSDDTSIWFFQITRKGVMVIDFHTSNGKDIDYYVDEVLKDKNYPIDTLFLPHDAAAKRLGAKKTVEEQFRAAGKFKNGWKVRIVIRHSIQDGIQAARKTMKSCYIDQNRCFDGIEALKMYRREWDDDKKCFREHPLHDWSSNPADAFRYLAMAWRELKPEPKPPGKMKNINDMTIEDLWKMQSRQQSGGRI
jgi:phage terminase large subunit